MILNKIFNIKFILFLMTLILCNNFIVAQDSVATAKQEEKAVSGINWGGQINAYYLATFNHQNTTNQSFSNGLLPASLSALPHWSKGNISVNGTVGIYAGLNSIGTDGSGNGGALAFSTVDIRQLFFTINHKQYGSLTIGRNFGLFGFDAIINDISLLGVGASYSPTTPQHTSLGGIGYGYIYCDRFTQFNYSTNSLGGLVLTVGGYQPINQTAKGANGTLGFQAKAAFTKEISKDNSLYLSASFLTQKIDSLLQGNGYDVYAKLKLQGLTVSGYFYGGNGIGDVGLYLGGIKTPGKEVSTSKGYYAQISYALKSSLTFGLNYGSSKLSTATKTATRVTSSLSYTTGPVIWRGEFTNLTDQPLLGVGAANMIALGATYAF